MKISEWKRALTNCKFKSNLTKFYTIFLAESAHILVDEDTSIIVSGGLEETTLKVNSDKVTFMKELNSNQEEADTRLLLHAHYESNNGSGSVVIVSPDTDVLVLCMHHFDTLGIKNLYFKTGRKLVHIDSIRYIPVHTIHHCLSVNQRNIMLQVYCITGCDTCCAFYEIWKKTAFNIMMKVCDSFQSMKTIGDSQVLSKTEKYKHLNL